MNRLRNLRKEDVPYLTDEELFQAFQIRGKKIGPVVGSTRQLYARKLVSLLKEEKVLARNNWRISEEKDGDVSDAGDGTAESDKEFDDVPHKRTLPVVCRKQHSASIREVGDAPAARLRNPTAKPGSAQGRKCLWLVKFTFVTLLLIAVAVVLLNYCDSMKDFVTSYFDEFSLAELGTSVNRLVATSWSEAKEDA